MSYTLCLGSGDTLAIEDRYDKQTRGGVVRELNPPPSGTLWWWGRLKKGYAMQLGIGIIICSLVVAGAVLSGCATGGSSGANSSTQQDRNEAAWKRAEAHGN